MAGASGPGAKITYCDRYGRTVPPGEVAVVVRALADGVEVGVTTRIPRLTKGRYALSCWACADIEEKATVRAHLAGKDLREHMAGEEYARFVETVAIDKTHGGAALRIWTSTPKVRVWFDDVALRPVK